MTETKTQPQEVGFSAPAQAGGDLATQDAGNSLLNFVAMAVKDPTINVEKLDALLRMQREIVADDARSQFNRALHAAQMDMPRVSKNGTIDMGGKGAMKFAKWEDVDAVLRPIMRKHGFSLSFDVGVRGDGSSGGGVVTGTLMHAAGHSKQASIPLPNDAGAGRNALQAMGSTLSYGKRYVAEMLFNIVRKGEDDDGVAGGTSYITEAQKNELVELQAETQADTTAFLAYLRVATLDDLETKDFTKARNALLQKKAAQAGKKS